ncbi:MULTISPECIES: fimbrial biogenesis chaperone [Winslowiella]|uniref:molecular chaperone n=1 Tax=Winslowiella TaxID=2997349 RepID=UPI0028BD2736|nr:molecular chaperone [Winslowiella toletana]WNN44563.1 molecular chaperone [Winslowiella toletana]
MIKKLLLLLQFISGISASSVSQAAWFDSIIYDMDADQNFIARRVLNNTGSSKLYNVSAVRIDKPGVGGENASPLQQGELLYAPLKFFLEKNQSEFFKIYYKGPQDDRERYYRISYSETPLNLVHKPDAKQAFLPQPVISMSTILIVRPRKINLSWHLDEQKGVLMNNGNTYFTVLIHKGCEANDNSATRINLLPGEHFSSHKLKDINKKFIVGLKKYMRLGKGCF